VLVAKDHGTPISHETLRFLTVLLVDTDDNRPEFPVTESTNPYSFRVTENSQINLLVGMCMNAADGFRYSFMVLQMSRVKEMHFHNSTQRWISL
jgi:hypothetical protein